MIVKSVALTYPSDIGKTFEEKCAMCNAEIPEGMQVLRNPKTNNILCIVCLTEIADLC